MKVRNLIVGLLLINLFCLDMQSFSQGNALNFGGYTNSNTPPMVVIPHSNSFIMPQVTVELWVKPGIPDRDGFQSILTKINSRGSAGQGHEEFAILQDGNKFKALMNGASVLNSKWATQQGTFEYNRWYHVAATFSSTAVALYVDGILQESVPTGFDIDISSTNPIQLGYYNNPGNFGTTAYQNYYIGSMDEIRIWNTIRTQQQIIDNKDIELTTGIHIPDLVSYYNCNIGTAGQNNAGLTQLTDYVPFWNNGTISNFSLNGETANWVNSYAMVYPKATAATAISANTFTANWTAATKGITALKYYIDVSTNQNFSSYVTYDSTYVNSIKTYLQYNNYDAGSGTSTAIKNLNPSTTYYYRVRAAIADGSSSNSNVMTVTTASSGSQLINFGTLASKKYGDADFAPGATASSNLAVSYSSSNTNVATIVDGLIHIVGAGSCTINANQAGDNNLYNAAPQVSQTLTVNKATLTFKPDNMTLLPGSNFPAQFINYTVTGWVYGSWEGVSTWPTISLATTATSPEGFYPGAITMSGGFDKNYAFNYIAGDVSISKYNQTITFNALPAKFVGDQDFNAGATTDAGLIVTYTSSDPTVATILNGKIHIVGPGTCTIYANQSGNASYKAATQVSQMLTVTEINNALNFDGVNDFVNCGNILTASYTKEAWINPSAATGYLNVISGTANHALWVVNGQLCAGHNGNWFYVVDAATIPANAWTHVALTYDAATSTMKLYKNGVLVIANNAVPAITTDNSLQIGAYNSNVALFNGSIDEVKIWNRALTDAEIAADKSVRLTGSESGLVAYYDFNSGTDAANNAGVTTLQDKSLNGNNGVLYNFALSGATSNWVKSSIVVLKNQAAPSVSVNDINFLTESVGNLATTMEFSIDGGTTWMNVPSTVVSVAPFLTSIPVSVQIRYKANATSYASPSTTIILPARPQNLPVVSVTDIDYSNNRIPVLLTMQYSVDAGINWNSVSAPSGMTGVIQKAQQTGAYIDLTLYLTTGVNLLIRNQPTASDFGSIYTTIVIPKAPDAPSNPVENLSANTFGFTLNPTFTNLSDYEFSVDGGVSYIQLQSNPIVLNAYKAYPAGSIIVRTKAVTGKRFAGMKLVNQSTYTLSSNDSPLITIKLSGIVNDTQGMSSLIGGTVKAGDPFSITVIMDRSASTDTNPDNNVASYHFSDPLSKIDFKAGTFSTVMNDFNLTINKTTGYFSVFNSLFKLEANAKSNLTLGSDQIPSQLDLLSFDFKPIGIMFMGITLLKFDFTVTSAEYTSGVTTGIQDLSESLKASSAFIAENRLWLKNIEQSTQVSITNLKGENVFTGRNVGNSIDITHLAKGIFIITLTETNGNKTIFKLLR